MRFSRRGFLKHTGTGLITTAGVLALGNSVQAASGIRVNGSGSYYLGPFQNAKDRTKQAFLLTDLGFDETMIYCKVTTNFDPFLFPTAKLGTVELGAHEFFMDMQSTRIDSLSVQDGTSGPKAVYAGTLRSETKVFSGDKTVTFIEDNISFDCEATDLAGPSATVEITKTNFSMTASFNPSKEHAAVFGQQVTFAGRLIRGNIIIVKGDGKFPVLTITNATASTRIPDALVGDTWRLDLTSATANAPVYLQMWKNNQDLGVSGPYGANTDQQGRWSHSGRFDAPVTGAWRLKAIIGDSDSPERSGTIAFNVLG